MTANFSNMDRASSTLEPPSSSMWTHLHHALQGFRALPLVTKLQMGLVFFNAAAIAIVLNAVRLVEAERVDLLLLSYSIELFIFCEVTVLYCLSAENEYAFFLLLVMQVEFLAISSGAVILGVLHSLPLWARIALLVWMWISFGAFLFMQSWFRRYWGYRTFEVAGSNPVRVQDYKRYQLLTAAVMVDVFHTIYFATGHQILVDNHAVWQKVLIWAIPAGTLALSRLLINSVRAVATRRVVAIFVIHAVFLSTMTFLSLWDVVDAVNRHFPVADAGTNMSPSAQWNFLCVVSWISVTAKAILLWNWFGVRALLETEAMVGLYPSSYLGYMINDGHNNTRDTENSRANRPRQSTAVIYDATVRTAADVKPSQRVGPADGSNSHYRTVDSGQLTATTEAMVPSRQLFT
jgi:hypothetical protein